MRATVNIVDSRAIFRMDMGFYIGSPYKKSMSFWLASKIDPSSCGCKAFGGGHQPGVGAAHCDPRPAAQSTVRALSLSLSPSMCI